MGTEGKTWRAKRGSKKVREELEGWTRRETNLKGGRGRGTINNADRERRSAPSRAGPTGSRPCLPTPRRVYASRRRGRRIRRRGCGGTARASWPGHGRAAYQRRRRGTHWRPVGSHSVAAPPSGFRFACGSACPRPAFHSHSHSGSGPWLVRRARGAQPQRARQAGVARVARGPREAESIPAVVDEDGEPVQLRKQELRIVCCVPVPAHAAFPRRALDDGMQSPLALQPPSGTARPTRLSYSKRIGGGGLGITVRAAPPCGSRTGWRTCRSAVDYVGDRHCPIQAVHDEGRKGYWAAKWTHREFITRCRRSIVAGS